MSSINRNLKLDERNKILDLHHKSKLNISQISTQLGITRATVRRWIDREANSGSIEDRPRYHPPRKLSADRVAHMLQVYSNQPFSLSTTRFAEQYQCTTQAIRNALHQAGVHYTKHEKTMFLTAKQKESRLRFARDYRDLDFSQAIFADEKSLKFYEHGRHKIWRIINNRKNPENVDPDENSVTLTVNMWGWMSASGPGELIHTKINSTAQSYVELLDEVLLPTVRTVHPVEEFPTFYLFEENSGLHRAQVVQNWRKEHPEIKTVFWPPRSPDLNPVKNLWGLMVQKWEKNNKSKTGFMSHCDKVWESIRGTDFCEVLARSMKDRCDAVIDVGGAVTKYCYSKE